MSRLSVRHSRALLLSTVLALAVAAVGAGFLTNSKQRNNPRSQSLTTSPSVASSSYVPPMALPTYETVRSVDPKLTPQFRMPFPAGVVVLCCQGNHAEPGRTHALAQNAHALDFSSRVLGEVPIVAAAAGVVTYLVNKATDESAGGGYGNQVRLLHNDGLYTLYAHLDRVSVRIGQRVAAGQKLGTMGKTGMAGDRHLHFSLHQGTIDQEGVSDTFEIPALLTYELGASGGFTPRSSGEFRCSAAKNPWAGGLYASENSDGPPLNGLGPKELERRISDAQAQLSRSLVRRSALWELSQRALSLTRDQYRNFLEPIIAEAPGDPVAHYTWAVEVELSARRFQSASQHLDIAEKAARNPALFEPWLNGWIEAQRGTISLALGHTNDAHSHFTKASELLPIVEIEQYTREQYRRFSSP